MLKQKLKNLYLPVNISSNKLIEIATYIIENNMPLRQVARETKYKKSTLHRYLHYKLKDIAPELYLKLCNTFKENKKEGVSKGGKISKEKRKQSRGES